MKSEFSPNFISYVSQSVSQTDTECVVWLVNKASSKFGIRYVGCWCI